jgi:hypothetical protein
MINSHGNVNALIRIGSNLLLDILEQIIEFDLVDFGDLEYTFGYWFETKNILSKAQQLTTTLNERLRLAVRSAGEARLTSN